MSERLPRKRPAFEAPAVAAPDPAMRRPASVTAGAVLVLLRAAAGIVWLLSFALGWDSWIAAAASAFGGDASDDAALPTGTSAAIRTTVLVTAGVGAVLQATLGVLILRGWNWPRVLVMVISTLSICSGFVGWWVQGQDIRIATTFVTLSLDILILLALSSRNAAAYARRRRGSPRRG